jgi:coenzyme F420 hydrogenase subunit beta
MRVGVCRVFEGDLMPNTRDPEPVTGPHTCVTCGGLLRIMDVYHLDIADRDVSFYGEQCASCGNEYVNAPDILRPDEEIVKQFEPEKSPVGSYRKVQVVSSRDSGLRPHPGGKVAATLLSYLLEKDLADVVFLAHQSFDDDAVMAYSKEDLVSAGELRMSKARSIVTTGSLRANLLSLTQLRRFADADAGRHPRIAVMGRPCQVYTAQKLHWERFLPGYVLAFGLGTFCYGNFAPYGWGGELLREMLGFPVNEIRRVEYIGEEVQFSPRRGSAVRLAQESVVGLVNPNCLQCHDFTARFGDISVGPVGRDDLFEAAIVRTKKGSQILEGAIREGHLAPLKHLYPQADEDADAGRALVYLGAMTEIKRELTSTIR